MRYVLRTPCIKPFKIFCRSVDCGRSFQLQPREPMHAGRALFRLLARRPSRMPPCCPRGGIIPPQNREGRGGLSWMSKTTCQRPQSQHAAASVAVFHQTSAVSGVARSTPHPAHTPGFSAHRRHMASQHAPSPLPPRSVTPVTCRRGMVIALGRSHARLFCRACRCSGTASASSACCCRCCRRCSAAPPALPSSSGTRTPGRTRSASSSPLSASSRSSLRSARYWSSCRCTPPRLPSAWSPRCAPRALLSQPQQWPVHISDHAACHAFIGAAAGKPHRTCSTASVPWRDFTCADAVVPVPYKALWGQSSAA